MQSFNVGFPLLLSFREIEILYDALYKESKRWDLIISNLDDESDEISDYANDGPLLSGLIKDLSEKKTSIGKGQNLELRLISKQAMIIMDALENKLKDRSFSNNSDEVFLEVENRKSTEKLFNRILKKYQDYISNDSSF